MERQVALILSIIFFIVFALLSFYGCRVSLWSSLIFSVFVALILLNIFYPPSQVSNEDADIMLVVYAAFEIIGIVLLAIYITLKTLGDVRTDCVVY